MNQHANEDIPWSPVPMDDSPTLFPMDRSEFRDRSSVTDDLMRDWYQLGLLSFDVSEVSQLEDCHLAEVQIVSSLLEAELPPDAVEEMLASLPKPYRYDPRRLCYNFFLRMWQMVPSQSMDQITDEIREELSGEISEQFDAYIDELAEEGNVETLEALRAQVVTAIERAESTGVDE